METFHHSISSGTWTKVGLVKIYFTNPRKYEFIKILEVSSGARPPESTSNYYYEFWFPSELVAELGRKLKLRNRQIRDLRRQLRK